MSRGLCLALVVTTAPLSVFALEITGLSAAVWTSSATLSWQTNVPADSQVEHGLSLDLGMSTLLSPAKGMAHSVLITGLSSNKTYRFRAKSRDAVNNIAQSQILSVPTQAVADRPLTFGVASHPMWYSGSGAPARLAFELNTLVNAGVQSYRFDLSWAALENSRKGAYADAGSSEAGYLAWADSVIWECHQRGLQMIITVIETPRWANGADGSDPNRQKFIPPARAQDYGDIMAFLAKRYEMRNVIWEIWNEPNDSGHWQPSPNAAQYADMCKTAYTSIKSVAGNPNATVLGGSILWNDRNFLNGMYARWDATGGGTFFDGLAIHPYTLKNPPDWLPSDEQRWWSFEAGLIDHRARLDAHGDTDKGLWITEMGWSTLAADAEGRFTVEEHIRADNMRKAVQITRRHGTVQTLTPYKLISNFLLTGFGLVDSNGMASPSWQSYTKEIAGASDTTPPAAPRRLQSRP